MVHGTRGEISNHLYYFFPTVDRFSEGVVKPILTIPGLKCPACTTYRGMRRIPRKCPDEIASFLSDRPPGPMSLQEFKTLHSIWAKVRDEDDPATLQPGDIFSPLKWTPPKNASSRKLFWPQFSNVVSTRQLFEEVCEIAPGCIEAVEIDGSPYVEWHFVWSTASFAATYAGNVQFKCKVCDLTETRYSEKYETLLQDQTRGRWIERSNISPQPLFKSHIYFPGFLASEPLATFLLKMVLTSVGQEIITIPP